MLVKTHNDNFTTVIKTELLKSNTAKKKNFTTVKNQ